VLGPFIAHGFGHLEDAAFCAGVGGDVVVCYEGYYRGYVYYLRWTVRLVSAFVFWLHVGRGKGKYKQGSMWAGLGKVSK